jgi:PAS domain S-box-containing protein
MAFEWDPSTNQSRRSENAADILGFEQVGTAGSRGDNFLSRIHPDDRASLKTHIRELRPDSPSYALSFRYVRPDGREIWLEETARGEFDATGRIVRIKGLTRDVNERRRAEERQRVLVAELDHRVKNALATVMAVVARTQQSSKSVTDFAEALGGRIQSMAAAHELLSARRWQGISLTELVQRELAPYTSNNAETCGPEIILRAEAGLWLVS